MNETEKKDNDENIYCWESGKFIVIVIITQHSSVGIKMD